MKAIYVPEKIYVHWSKHAKRLCTSAAQVKGDIEYVHTDAFIEKAAKWINEHTSLSEKLVIENFRKYMKGE